MLRNFLLFFMLLTSAAHADNTPTYDNRTGLLTLPLVSTPLGSYTATLQLDFLSQQIAFTLKQAVIVDASTISGDTTYLPTYDFDTGLLRLPIVNAATGNYAATFQFNQEEFQINDLVQYTATVSTPPPNLLGCFISTSTNS